MKKSDLLFCAALFAFIGLLLPAGCTGPAAQPSDVTSAGVNKNCVDAQTVVHYFLAGQRHYFTEQQHIFCPDQKSLLIASHEPQGRFEWLLQGGRYSAGKAPEKPDPADAYWNRALVSASYYLMTVGGEFLPAPDATNPDPVKIEGQYYLELNPKAPGLSSLRLYRNQANGKVDLVQVEDKNGQLWMAKSYNWNYYAPTGKLIPRKIDFFDISKGISSKELKIRIDYSNVQ